uniref:Uncharacterized protein n=1 Tax=Rhizophora mucronata TaxID=61149 RepID=A0A2P2KSM2_RHIMU
MELFEKIVKAYGHGSTDFEDWIADMYNTIITVHLGVQRLIFLLLTNKTTWKVILINQIREEDCLALIQSHGKLHSSKIYKYDTMIRGMPMNANLLLNYTQERK